MLPDVTRPFHAQRATLAPSIMTQEAPRKFAREHIPSGGSAKEHSAGTAMQPPSDPIAARQERMEAQLRSLQEALELTQTAYRDERRRRQEGEDVIEQSLKAVSDRSEKLQRRTHELGWATDGSPQRLQHLAVTTETKDFPRTAERSPPVSPTRGSPPVSPHQTNSGHSEPPRLWSTYNRARELERIARCGVDPYSDLARSQRESLARGCAAHESESTQLLEQQVRFA